MRRSSVRWWLRILGATLVAVSEATLADSPASAQSECLTLEDFAGGPVGGFPSGWRARKSEGEAVYTVRENGGVRFLHADSKDLGIQAAKQVTWDLDAYPILVWSWRPVEFPRGADERDGKNDSALAVYMLVDHSRIRGPKAVKYIWSERVPVGTRLDSNMGLTQVKVLRSGPPSGQEWVEERVDVRADFKQFFSQTDAPKPAGIAVLTDADDTNSRARGDYGALRACRP
jgi:hypothetical protein